MLYFKLFSAHTFSNCHLVVMDCLHVNGIVLTNYLTWFLKSLAYTRLHKKHTFRNQIHRVERTVYFVELPGAFLSFVFILKVDAWFWQRLNDRCSKLCCLFIQTEQLSDTCVSAFYCIKTNQSISSWVSWCDVPTC